MAEELLALDSAVAGDVADVSTDTGNEEVVDTEDVVADPDVTDTQDENQEDPDQTEDTTDEGEGASKPTVAGAQMRKYLNEFKKLNPQAAEAVGKAYFKLQEFEKVVPTIAAARTLKATLDEVGGVEGLTDLRGRADQFADELNRFNNADRSVVKDWATDSPESFAKLAPAVLEELYNTSKEAYFETLAPVFNNTLNQWQFPQHLTDIGGLLEDAYVAIKESGSSAGHRELDKAYKLLQGMAGNIKQVSDAAAKVGTKPTANPEQEKLKGEWTKLEQEREKDFTATTESAIDQKFSSAISSALSPLLKTRKLSNDAKALLTGNVQAEVQKAMRTDQNFVRQANSLMKTKDKAKLISLMSAKIAELTPNAARSVFKKLYGGGALPKTGTKLVVKGTVVKGTRPRREDIDQNWLSANGEAYITGTAKLKNGTIVRFDPNA